MIHTFEPSEATKASQCTALLAALQSGPITTLDARDKLGILSPAARVLDLRRTGHAIITTACTSHDLAGRQHRTALYRLEDAPR